MKHVCDGEPQSGTYIHKKATGETVGFNETILVMFIIVCMYT